MHKADRLEGWFELYERIIEEYNIHVDDRYNMDEKGYALGKLGKARVYCPKWELVTLAQDGSREWASLIECVSATGRLLTAFFIFAGKQIQNCWIAALEDDNRHINMTENGWTNNAICLRWFEEIFIPQTKDTKGDYRLLIVDGHGSHVTHEVIKLCLENKIVLLCLPAHSTDLLQPLDVAIFGPFAHAYKKGLKKCTQYGKNYHIDKVDFLQVVQPARHQSVTPSNTASGWRRAGLVPFDPQAVLKLLPKVDNNLPPLQPPASLLVSANRSFTPPEIQLIAENGRVTINTLYTPHKALETNSLIAQLNTGSIDQNQLPAIIEKLGKAAITSMTEAQLHKQTNKDIMELQVRQEAKKKRERDRLGEARHLNETIFKERLLKELRKDFVKFAKLYNTTEEAFTWQMGDYVSKPKTRKPRKRSLSKQTTRSLKDSVLSPSKVSPK